MIYGSSNHPVEVKKVKIRVWTLRDEILCILKDRLEAAGNDPAKVNLEDLQVEYKDLIKLPNSILKEQGLFTEDTIKTGEELDDSEDEMAKALAEAEAGANAEAETSETDTEEKEDEKAEESEGGDDAEAMAATMLEGQGGDADSEMLKMNESNIVTISRMKPNMPSELVVEGILLLSDINMHMISCFCKKQFLHGQSIVIEFLVPNHFYASGEVLECMEFNRKSRIISEQRSPFRLHARFTFSRPGEKTLLRRFLKSIEPEIPVEVPKKPRSDGDELGDLEDLGL